MSDVEKLNKLLIANNCVYSLSLINEKDIGYDLNLGLGSIENSKAVSIDFHDIHGLALNVDAGVLVQFMHLKAKKLEYGLERIKYKVYDVENNLISFKCASFTINEI